MPRRTLYFAMIVMVTIALSPLYASEKQAERPWWEPLLNQYAHGTQDGLRFSWNGETSQIDVLGDIEFVFLGKSSTLPLAEKQLSLTLYRRALSQYWSLPFEGTEDRADITACKQTFAGFSYDHLNFRIVNESSDVATGANRVYLYFNSQVPQALAFKDFLHATFPTISGPEGRFEHDPFWARKGEGVLPAFTQFLPLPLEAGVTPPDDFGQRDPSAASWILFVGHEFGHALGLSDGWHLKGEQVVATDTDLMSYLYWELNPEPRTTHAYFAEIISRVFLCSVNWTKNGRTYWVEQE